MKKLVWRKLIHCKQLITRSFVGLFAVVLISNAAVMGNRHVDDVSDAWVSVNQMIRFIETGDLPSTETAGTRAIGSIEKVLDAEKNSGKREKLRDAITDVREALSNASKGAWPYAEAAAKRASKKLDELR